MTSFTAEHAAALVDRLEPSARGLVLVELVARVARDAAAAVVASQPAQRSAAEGLPLLLATTHAAKHLGVGPGRLRDLAVAGEIHSFKRPGEQTRWFRVADLEAWTVEQTRQEEQRRREVVRPIRGARGRGVAS